MNDWDDPPLLRLPHQKGRRIGANGSKAASFADTLSRTLPDRPAIPRNKPAPVVPTSGGGAVPHLLADPTPLFAGASQGVVRIGPLNPGHYDFIGEYHEETAKGTVIAELCSRENVMPAAVYAAH